MKRKINYTNEPMKFKVVDDFLPPPDELVLKEDNVKVTINLKKSNIDFFKKWASQKHGHYQAMIRQILDQYVAHYR